MPASVGIETDTGRWGRLRRRLLAVEFTPLRVTLLYLAFGFTALYVSDVFLFRALEEPLLTQVQAVKGAVEVVLTGGVIFLLTRRSRSQLRRTNETLHRQREELDVLHRVLRHNLRNALTVIAGRAEILRRTSSLGDEESDHASRIQTTAEDIVGLIEQASRIRRVTDQEGHLVTVDLTDAVQSAIEDHPDVPADVDLRSDLPETAPASVNHLLEEALEELITNAVTHNDADRPRISITVDPDAGRRNEIAVIVADDGPGVGEHVQAVFERGELDQLLHLDGMGLWFVYWTVTDSGGSFAIEDNEWGGTAVRLTVPRHGVQRGDAPVTASVFTG